MNTKNAFSAAQNRSKRTVSATASNATNASHVAGSLTAAGGPIRRHCGKPTHQASKPPHSLHKSTDAAAKPSCAISKRPRQKHSSPLRQKPTSSWTPPASAAHSASWFCSTTSAGRHCLLPKSKTKPTCFTPKQ